MGESLQRLDQIAKPDSFDDQLTAAQIASIESSAGDLGEFWEGVLSQLKRIIHGNQAGNWYDDPPSSVISRDLIDNNTDYIVVGNITTDRKVVLNYSYELPIADKAITGRLTLNHDGSSVNADNDYSFLDQAVVDSVEMSAVIVGTELRWTIVTNGVGENPTVKYRRLSISVV